MTYDHKADYEAIAQVFHYNRWTWADPHDFGHYYIPEFEDIKRVVDHLKKNLDDDENIVSSSSGRLTVSRDELSGLDNVYTVSVEFGDVN